MDAELKTALEAMEARIMKRFEETDERVHDAETRLLRAFHSYASTTDLRLKELPLFSQRLEVLEGGIGEVERKLLEKRF
jgi:hypothetical protein